MQTNKQMNHASPYLRGVRRKNVVDGSENQRAHSAFGTWAQTNIGTDFRRVETSNDVVDDLLLVLRHYLFTLLI